LIRKLHSKRYSGAAEGVSLEQIITGLVKRVKH
jgi:hypothetical protein